MYNVGLQKQYVSTIELADTREMRNKVVDVQNENPADFMDVMDSMGRVEETFQPTYHNHTNQPIFAPETVVSATPDAGNPRRVTVVLDGNAPSALRGAQTRDHFGQSGVVFSRTEDPAGTIIVVDSAGATPLNFVAADQITFFASAFGEGSRGAESRRSTLDKHFNQVQIFKNAASQTDIQAVSKVEFEFDGQPYYFIKEQHEEWIRFRSSLASGLFASTLSDPNFTQAVPTLFDDEGKPVQTTRGIDQELRENGQNYGPTATDVDFLETWTLRADKLRSPDDYCIYQDTRGGIAWDRYWGLFNNGVHWSDNARLNVNGKDLDLGMNKVSIFGRNFYTKKLQCLIHDGVFGVYNDLSNASYWIPESKIKNYMGGGMVDRLRVRYMKVNGKMYDEILTGALAPVPTNTYHHLRVSYSARMGAEIIGAQHMSKVVGL